MRVFKLEAAVRMSLGPYSGLTWLSNDLLQPDQQVRRISFIPGENFQASRSRQKFSHIVSL
jgi:hypothetical protein